MSIKELVDANNDAVNNLLGKGHNPANLKKELLVGKVILEIERSFEMSDLEAVYELLGALPKKNLIAFLPEEEWKDL